MTDQTTPAPATALPWALRPQEYDDWGVIRAVNKCELGFQRHVCKVAYVASPEDLNEHRRAGTDPTEQDAAYIVTACNSFPALVAALQDAVEGIDRGNLDQRYCCNGDMCGCQGSTYREFLLHNLRAALSLALGEQ